MCSTFNWEQPLQNAELHKIILFLIKIQNVITLSKTSFLHRQALELNENHMLRSATTAIFLYTISHSNKPY